MASSSQIMWKPNLAKVDVDNKPGYLLSEALNISVRKWKQQIKGVAADSNGKFAFELTDFILVAKSYIYGNIVSCHKSAVERAIHTQKALVMYIENEDKFYMFNPERIARNGEINIRGGMEMINFKITYGVNKQ